MSMNSITLAGRTIVLYFDPADYEMDGNGWNVLVADSAWTDRFPTLEQATAHAAELYTGLYPDKAGL